MYLGYSDMFCLLRALPAAQVAHLEWEKKQKHCIIVEDLSLNWLEYWFKLSLFSVKDKSVLQMRLLNPLELKRYVKLALNQMSRKQTHMTTLFHDSKNEAKSF